MNLENLRSLVRDVPDYPKVGVVFKDINPLLADPDGFDTAISGMARPYLDSMIDSVVGIEARGFIFAAGIATILSAGVIPVRKPGKLPLSTKSVKYALEYGTDTLEIQTDAITEGQRVIIVDDVLATGGTMSASIELVRMCGADIVGVCCFIELDFLKGREKFDRNIVTSSLINY
tara:strand:- start:10339 stop:10863 length:525 start_codon:yes stop_codon:yes gene_type:complete